MTRIFFACDIHGSEIVWRKFLKMASQHQVDILMLLGDLTGKAVLPIIKKKENEWFYAPEGKEIALHSREEVDSVIEMYRNRGIYIFETTLEKVKELQADPRKVDELFAESMKNVLRNWISMVKEKIPKNVKVVISPGNDDDFIIDEVIKEDDRVIYPLEKVVDLDGKHDLISCAWSNPTPWGTPRECSENELKKKLENEFRRVESCENLVCNFHVPPYNSGLDMCPKLDKNLKPIMEFGVPVTYPAGSKSVRELIEKNQPLLGLHGHIHESAGFRYIGRTLCVNSGSEYEQGILRGYIIDLPPRKFEFWRVEA
ncbi:MAG: phosphoesterase [Candidatus Bathyarchaeia archaeon]